MRGTTAGPFTAHRAPCWKMRDAPASAHRTRFTHTASTLISHRIRSVPTRLALLAARCIRTVHPFCAPSSPLSHSPYSRSVRAPPLLTSPLPRAATRHSAGGSPGKRRATPSSTHDGTAPRARRPRLASPPPSSTDPPPPRPPPPPLLTGPGAGPLAPHPPSSSHGGGAAVSGERRHTLPPSSFPASFPASSSSPSPQVLPVSPAVDPVRWCGPRLFSTTAAAAAAAAAAPAVAAPATARGGG